MAQARRAGKYDDGSNSKPAKKAYVPTPSEHSFFTYERAMLISSTHRSTITIHFPCPSSTRASHRGAQDHQVRE